MVNAGVSFSHIYGTWENLTKIPLWVVTWFKEIKFEKKYKLMNYLILFWSYDHVCWFLPTYSMGICSGSMQPKSFLHSNTYIAGMLFTEIWRYSHPVSLYEYTFKIFILFIGHFDTLKMSILTFVFQYIFCLSYMCFRVSHLTMCFLC